MSKERVLQVRKALGSILDMVAKLYDNNTFVFPFHAEISKLYHKDKRFKDIQNSSDEKEMEAFISEGMHLLNKEYAFDRSDLSFNPYIHLDEYYASAYHHKAEHYYAMSPILVAMTLGDEPATRALIAAGVELNTFHDAWSSGYTHDLFLSTYEHIAEIEPLIKRRAANRGACYKFYIDANTSLGIEKLSDTLKSNKIFETAPELKSALEKTIQEKSSKAGTNHLLTSSYEAKKNRNVPFDAIRKMLTSKHIASSNRGGSELKVYMVADNGSEDETSMLTLKHFFNGTGAYKGAEKLFPDMSVSCTFTDDESYLSIAMPSNENIMLKLIDTLREQFPDQKFEKQEGVRSFFNTI